MAVGKINKDLYVGDTGKQLKDIKNNSDIINNLVNRVQELEYYTNPIIDATLPGNLDYFGVSCDLGEGTYDFELKIVFDSVVRNVFVVPNGLWSDNKITYSFSYSGGRNQSSTPYYESNNSSTWGGLGIANDKNSYWTVFTGVISIRSGQFSMRGQGTSIDGQSIFGLKYEGTLNKITALHFLSADWQTIMGGSTFKVWRRKG